MYINPAFKTLLNLLVFVCFVEYVRYIYVHTNTCSILSLM